MKYELVVIWATGEKDIFEYDTREAAEEAGWNMKMALGNQIEWFCTRERR